MNKELREKMKESAEEYLRNMQEGGCIPNFEEDDFNAGNLYGAEKGFMKGSESMYAELSTIVEWVSVKDSMPENMNKILVKGFICGYGIKESSVEFGYYYDGDFHSTIDEVTHWKNIDL